MSCLCNTHFTTLLYTLSLHDALPIYWLPGQDTTVRIVRAIMAGCRAEPELNAWYDGEKLERTLHERVDLAMAVDTPEDRKSTRLNSSHVESSYAVFCLKKNNHLMR